MPGARVDVARRGLEDFARLDNRAALVVGHHGRDVRRRRDLGAIGRGGGDENGNRSVGRLEIRGRDALHVGRRHLPDAIAIEEEEPPVARGRPLGETDGDLLRVVHRQLDVLDQICLRAIDFFGGEGARRVECLLQRAPGGIE